MSTGENLLHVLNTLESRSVVLEAELREIDDDILLNATMQRKYGAESFTEGAAKLTQTRVRAAAFARTARAQRTRAPHARTRSPMHACTPCHATDLRPPASQLEKQQRLAEIRMQLQQTSQSVRQGKQLLGSLADNYGNATVPEPMMMAGSPERPPASTPGVGAGGDLPSPTRILTTSPILSEKRGRA